MDTLTHLLVGHVMGTAAGSVAGPMGAAAYWGVLVGNSLPDMDVPLSLLLRRNVSLHRTVTHTVPGAAGLSAAAALAIHWFLPGAPVTLLFLWTLMGALCHMAMDCLNLFGARPFWPLSGQPVELGVLHIVDPVLLLLLSVPTAVVGLGMAPPAALGLTFVAMWPYLLYRILTARRLYRRLRTAGPQRVRIIPWYVSWRYICETAHAIEFGVWVAGKPRATQTYPKVDSPLVQASLHHPKVRAFLASAEYPYAQVQEDEHGSAVVWKDALRQLRADFRPLRVRLEQSKNQAGC